jgi:predicted NodU family carbamoyl transferase
MNILGLNVFHADSAACLLQDANVAASVAEEHRGARRKHFAEALVTAGGCALNRADRWTRQLGRGLLRAQ